MTEHPLFKIKHMDDLVNKIYLNPKLFGISGDPGMIYDSAQRIAKEMLQDIRDKRWTIINNLTQ